MVVVTAHRCAGNERPGLRRDLFLAQRFATHASPPTTGCYAHPSNEALREVVRPAHAHSVSSSMPIRTLGAALASSQIPPSMSFAFPHCVLVLPCAVIACGPRV